MILAHAAGSAEFYWAIVAELSLVVWTVLLLVAAHGGPGFGRWRFRLTGFAAALTASAITLAGKTAEIWPGNPLFPSGHTAFGVTIGVYLVAHDRRWLKAAAPLACLMAVALVAADYHVAADIVGGAAVGLAVGLATVRWLSRAPVPADRVS